MYNIQEDLEKIKSGEQKINIRSSLPALIQGFSTEGLIVIGGYPGIGKSSLCTQIATDFIENEFPVIYYSLEMASISITKKIVSRISEVAIRKIEEQNFNEEEKNRFEETINKIEKYYTNKIQIIDNLRKISLPIIKYQIKNFMNDVRSNYGLVIIDNLQLFVRKEEKSIQKIMEKFIEYRDELKIPIIIVSTLNRNSKKIDSFYGSGMIGYSADIGILLEGSIRENNYQKVNLIIVKDRYVRLNTNNIPLRFYGEISKFEEIVKPEEVDI